MYYFIWYILRNITWAVTFLNVYNVTADFRIVLSITLYDSVYRNSDRHTEETLHRYNVLRRETKKAC